MTITTEEHRQLRADGLFIPRRNWHGLSFNQRSLVLDKIEDLIVTLDRTAHPWRRSLGREAAKARLRAVVLAAVIDESDFWRALSNAAAAERWGT